MRRKLAAFFLRTDVQLALLILQLTIYWLAVIYSPDSKGAVAYQRF